MGTSGAMSTSNQYVKYSITINQNRQSVENNYSNVSVYVNFWRTNSGYSTYGSGTCYCKINGTTYSATVSPSQKITSSAITLFSKTLDVYHNNDGSKTLTASAWINIDAPLSSSEQSYSQTLSTIPRASSISSINGNNFGSPITVNISRASSSFTHTVIYQRPDGNQFTVGTSIGTSCTFTPSLSDSNYVPNSISGSAKIIVNTYSGSTYIGSASSSFTIYVPSSVLPIINSVNLSEAVPGIASQFDAYVQGKSKIAGSITASGAYSSTIKSYSISINGASYTSSSFTTDSLNTSGNNACSVTVTDSRGRTASTSKTFTAVAYSNPVINSFSVSRCNGDGTANDEGACAKCVVSASISSVNSKNTKEFKIMYKKLSGTTWNTLTLSSSSYSLNTTQIIQNIDTESEYNFKAVATDYFNIAEYSHNLSTAYTLMDFNQSGKGLAIGKVSTQNAFEVNMDTIFKTPTTFNESITANGMSTFNVDTVFNSNVQISGENVVFTSGTWTPIPASTATYPTYSIYYRHAKYYRINDLVYITFHMKFNINNKGSGYVRIKGLPYASTNGCDGQAFAIREFSGGVSYTNGAVAMVFDNSSDIGVQNENGITSQMWNTGDTWVGFSGFYIKA